MRRTLQIIVSSFILLLALSVSAAETCLEMFTTEKEEIREASVQSNMSPGLEATMTRVDGVIEMALQAKLIKKNEAKHLREDLAELKSEPNPKEGKEGFDYMLQQWDTFIKDAEVQLAKYNALPKNEQKVYKSKMELPIYFATGHFIVFLETRDKKFNYGRMNGLLEALNTRSNKSDLTVYLYLMEKHARKFSSLREFRRCKA